MRKIIALIVVLSIAYLGYSRGMDGGQITLLIVVLGGLLFILGLLHKKYGTRRIAKGMVRGAMRLYDPTLPTVFEDDPVGLSSPYSSQVHIIQENDGPHSAPGEEVYSTRPRLQNTPPRLSETSSPLAHRQMEAGGYQQGRREVEYGFAPPAHATPFELALGATAFIDIQQAFVNSLFLGPSGQLLRVMVEELAAKGVPLLFIDVAGEYSTLMGEFSHGRRVCSPAAAGEDASSQKHTFLLDQESTVDSNHVGHALLQEAWQIFFDFSSYASPADAIVTLWDLIEGMIAWERAQIRRSGRFLPCIIVLTEAHRLCADDDQNSLFHENPELAKAVRSHVVGALKAHGTDGISWYLATRKITGMDSPTLRQCALWLIQQPQAMEVHAGWITAYTGIEPHELLSVPPSHALIIDRLSRNPQVVAFRESHSRHDKQGRGGYSLPSLSSTALLKEGRSTLLPFLDR